MLWSRIKGALEDRKHDTAVRVLRPLTEAGSTPQYDNYSSAEILLKVERLAWALFKTTSGLQSNAARVIIFIDKSLEYVISVLACVKLGLVFIPTSQEWDAAQFKNVVDSLCPHVAITGSSPTFDVESLLQSQCQLVDAHLAIFESAALPPVTDTETDRDTSNSARYILFTSGSTGSPKAILGTERGILNRCDWIEKHFPFLPEDVVAFTSATTFIDSIWQCLGPLSAGVTVLIVADSFLSQPTSIAAALAAGCVTHLVAVPFYLKHWKDALGKCYGRLKLRVVMSSGDFLSTQLSRDLLASLPHNCKLINLYGCAEAAADSTYYEVMRKDAGIQMDCFPNSVTPAGVPIHNTIIFVAEPLKDLHDCGNQQVLPGNICKRLIPVKRGGDGEIWIGGVGVSSGYVSNERSELNSRFAHMKEEDLRHAIDTDKSVLCGEQHGVSLGVVPFFRTGDQGRILDSGALHVLGRFDNLWKRNGVWIDIKFVESIVEQHPLVREAAMTLTAGEQHMHLYIVVDKDNDSSHDDKQTTAKEYINTIATCGYSEVVKNLRIWVQQNLPLSSVPNTIRIVREIPKSPAGKIMRTKLGTCVVVASESEDPDQTVGAQKNVAETKGEVSESRVLTVFREILGDFNLEPIGNFFVFGGNSLLAIEAASILKVDALLIQQFPSARELAQALSGKTRKVPSSYALLGNDSTTVYSLKLMSQTPSATDSCQEANRWVMQRVCMYPNNSPGSSFSRKRRRKLVPELSGQLPLHNPGSFIAETGCIVESSVLKRARPVLNIGNESVNLSGQDCLQYWHKGAFEFCCICCSPSSFRILWKDGEVQWEPTALDWSKTNGGRTNRDMFQLAWSRKLDQCVDATPALLRFGGGNMEAGNGLVLACSHGGQVSCFCLKDGLEMWSTWLDSSTDGGLAVASSLEFVAVSCEDAVCFLRLEDGKRLGIIHAGGAVKCAPTVDPWDSCIWATSHGNQILVIQASRTEVQRIHCKAPISCPVVFHPGQHRAFTASLHGEVIAMSVDCSSAQSGVEIAWIYSADGPVFSAPGVQIETGNVCFGTVRGTVCLLSTKGEPIWFWRGEAPIFSPILTMPKRILLATQTGLIVVLDLAAGTVVASIDPGIGSLAPQGLLLRSLSAAMNSDVTRESLLVCLLCSTTGVLMALEICREGTGVCSVVGSVRMQKEVQSGFVSVGNIVAFGSRDEIYLEIFVHGLHKTNTCKIVKGAYQAEQCTLEQLVAECPTMLPHLLHDNDLWI